MKVIILKLGGSIITNKRNENSIKWDTLRRLGEEIRKAYTHISTDARLIIVHGGGSFGHPLAIKYKKTKGRYDSEAFITIRENMNTLASIVSLLYINLGLPITHFQSSSLFLLDNGRIVKAYIEPIENSLRKNIIPLLYGDIAIDLTRGFEILSGDSIVAFLANYFNTIKVLYATDVSGIYSEDPKINSTAKRIEKILILKNRRSGEYKISLEFKDRTRLSADVTGGIYRKLLDLAQYSSKSITAYIFNGLIEGNVFKAIMDKPKEYTLVEVKVL